MVWMPRWITQTFTAQKARKQANWEALMPKTGNGEPAAKDGRKTPRILWTASPPIQVWMPNQPQATSARSSAGMLAPSVPKEARQ